MYCNKCGKKIEDGKILCDECEKESGKEIQVYNEEDEARKYLKLALILFIIGCVATPMSLSIDSINKSLHNESLKNLFNIITPSLTFLLQLAASIASPLSVITVIVSKVKFPKNKSVSLVFNIMVGLFIFCFISFILVIYACVASCRGIDG